MRYIEGIHRKSKITLPEYIDDYIAEDNPVRVMDAFVESLDMNELGFKNASPKDKGRPGYNLKDMLKLFIYGYMNRINSSRRLEKAAQTNIEVNNIEESIDRQPSKEEIDKKIKELKERKEKYENYKKEIKEGNIKEISTTDPDSRLMAVNNNGVDVCYNVQSVVDSKHKLIVDLDVINNPTDYGMLSKMAGSAKEIFEVNELKALADKGYYNAEDLKKCDQEGITTYVSKHIFSNSTGEEEFYIDKFKYNKEENVYICPQGEKLYSTRRKPIDEKTKSTIYKNSAACNKCEVRDKCTRDKKGRRISRPMGQDLLDIVG